MNIPWSGPKTEYFIVAFFVYFNNKTSDSGSGSDSDSDSSQGRRRKGKGKGKIEGKGGKGKGKDKVASKTDIKSEGKDNGVKSKRR